MNTGQPSIRTIRELEEPIRGELFSTERLEQHAESLAAAQAATTVAGPGRPFIPRVQKNGRILLEYYRAIARGVQREQLITPAAEWLVDNFYIVEEQLREIRDDLPPGYYRQLPKLKTGHLEGYPRVFGVAWAFVAHTDSRFDPEVLRRFVIAYQRVQPLTIGELWAVAITLRATLLENLRRIAEQLGSSRTARAQADFVADSLLGTGGQTMMAPEKVLNRFEKKPLERAFAVQLIQRLRDLDPKVGPILRWLDARLATQGTTADEIVRTEHQQQSAMSVTVRNIITSMRLTSAFDWPTFIESVSLVDEVLRADGCYCDMDFATRDHYRHAIEELSRGTHYSEIEVAKRAVQRARRTHSEKRSDSLLINQPDDDRLTNPGYYLISQGRMAFERELGFRVTWKSRLLRLYFRNAVPGYLGTIAFLTAIILGLPLFLARGGGTPSFPLVMLGFLATIPASDLAISLINRAVTDLFGPRTLPRLELSGGVPEKLRTIIVIPTLLTSPDAIKEQIERLEVHYLANSAGDLRFALLSDWVDAATESLEGDDELLAIATASLEGLNKRYGPAPGGGLRFILFHRKRAWNESDQKWMGWERKRGKLHELNQFLRGSEETSFLPVSGITPKTIPGVRYVITLDGDTRLPRGAAARLVGTMAHPLNRPLFDAHEARVVEGYGIVQPRITPSLPSDGEGSIFQKVFSGPSGMDPYASAISDIYQDLFREGSYTGKGIYEIDAFEEALAGKINENSVLSHDLLEGIFARAALATDIELFEEFPSQFEAAAARQHRWARGDWQLLPWIFGGGGTPRAGSHPYYMPAISRWKMVDNLRRTLLAPAVFLIMVIGWLMPTSSAWLWTKFVLITISVPALLPFLLGFKARLSGISKRSHIRGVLQDLSVGAAQIALTVTFLANQTWLMSDAIFRTIGRLLITRKNMLEWVTTAQSTHKVDLNLTSIYRRMAGGLALAIIPFLLVAFSRPQALSAGIPFFLLWCAAPAISKWISLPPKQDETEPLSASETQQLRLVSRRTWRYFETFVTGVENSLPPDNFQESPKSVVAHRTSPTNIGLYLLSTITARDLGWVGTLDTLGRLEATFETIAKLEKFRGHFYNWYDTRDLHPLDPKYVSSVDSGNIAGHLLAVRNACRELKGKTSFDTTTLDGMRDAIQLLRESLMEITDNRRTHVVTRKHLTNAVDALSAMLEPVPENSRDWVSLLARLKEQARTVVDIAHTLTEERGESTDSNLCVWANAVSGCLKSHARDAEILAPWMRLDSRPIAALAHRSPEHGAEWAAIEAVLNSSPALAEAPEHFAAAINEIVSLRMRLAKDLPEFRESIVCLDELALALAQAATDAGAFLRRLHILAQTAETIFVSMDFGFLFDRTRKLLSIGYRCADGTLDPNCYDLLASEARLASFIAIAKGDVPSSHWFHLGRALTPVGRGSALISWSGSMFEYLMPVLVMSSPSGSLLSQTYKQVVLRQMEYGEERGVPWGNSESAYNARDLDFTYQYSSFGVPGLGLKRGLSEDLVVAPYATALAAMIDPSAAAQNLARLKDAGAMGRYGLYEALDYTSSHLAEGKSVAVIQAYMAHHQAMSLVAFGDVLTHGAMRARFHAEPLVQAASLLLQERMPRDVLVARPRAEEVSAATQVRDLIPPIVRRFTTPSEATPRTQLLSNGRYSVMLTAAGSGYSRWKDLAITRWREDPTRDCWGTYIFLRDDQSGKVWSAGYQPSGAEPDEYEATFYEDHAEIRRRDLSLATALEVIVSPEDAEVRRLSITNLGARARTIQVTSYAELSLGQQAADLAHPAFSNLFVETEFVRHADALVATRRKRSADETAIWAAHVLIVEGECIGDLQYETDRARFLGRGRDIRNPVSIHDGRDLSNTVGSVLDPVMSLRRTVRIPPASTVRLSFSTIVAPTRDEVLALADKYRDTSTFERVSTLAWTQAQVQLHHLGIHPEEAQLFQRLANAVLYSDAIMRPNSDSLSKGRLDLPMLWAHGISGDLPIILARIDDPSDVEIIRQLLRAHEYWRMKQLSADLVIINEQPSSYLQELHESLDSLVRGSQLRLSPDTSGASGKIVLLRGDLLAAETRTQLQTVARAVILSHRGTLAEQITRSQPRQHSGTLPHAPVRTSMDVDVPLPKEALQFFNGFGGFAEKGREYVIVLSEGLRTPEPWINVIANPSFGFLVSESGAGFTWSLNSHENQLTPWSNDHVMDTPGETIYVRDEVTGDVWGPTALPIRHETGTYVARHGQGYSRFQNVSNGIVLDLVQFVPPQDPIKISRLILKNVSGRKRQLSVSAYAEWVLGSSRSASAPFIITEIDPDSGAFLARSAWNNEFGGRIAFADLAGKQSSYTGDRTEFLGRNGTPEFPAALARGGPLSGAVGAGLDPCAALQTTLDLAPGASMEIVFFLGEAEHKERVRELVKQYRAADLDELFRTVTSSWDEVLGAVQVTTPDPAMDLILNRWLLYQTLACRVWARAAFYQLSGAYGFRDQLQDVLALNVAKQGIAREHLLRAAARQFSEGDVQHWWHPPSGRGVRTRISDDLLWLPYAVFHFIEATGDMTVLEETVPFLEGDSLAEGKDESYFQPRPTTIRATLFEHCARALDRSLAVGRHGLPLMGTGDWNDGMNHIGEHGKGESVWLGWFLHTILWEFAKIAELRGESMRAESWRLQVSALKAALERDGWDGEWYRRAFFDDGTPLGSSQDSECRIDSIAQSWGVISGAAERGRAVRSMAAVDKHLIRRPEGLLLLLTPPFDNTPLDPGYIKAYLPGIRENGGQYTHAAAWVVIAFAALGDGDKAAELFQMLNPINRTNSRAGVQRYRVEPYVVAADIYSEPPHVGRGGWTWYTGSAGWLYRAGVEWILGFRVRGNMLSVDPCIPRTWPGYAVSYRYHSSTYELRVENPSSVSRGVVLAELDGKVIPGSPNIPLLDDGAVHQVRIVLGVPRQNSVRL
jgi:cyclic beta-1,2-glucan synthetase